MKVNINQTTTIATISFTKTGGLTSSTEIMTGYVITVIVHIGLISKDRDVQIHNAV